MNKIKFKYKSFFYSILFLTFSLSVNSYAQFTEFHPELEWYTIKSKNVSVHFHAEAERSARVVAKIADEVWGPITSLYNYEPDEVHFVIKDIDDYSNGATYFFDNKIEIWTSALDFDLRGTHNWLRNVISHEFTHMVQLQASMKFSRSIPAIYFQVLNYEDVRRPDILYGFPNVIVSYPLAGINVPAWFAEGTAQYMRPEFNYDSWDSHRDMILRSYALDQNMLTWGQMGVFGKTSLGNESVYNSGFALTKYIAQKYGEDKLRKISEALSQIGNFTIDEAFMDVLGKNGEEIYDEWRNFVTTDYQNRSEKVLSNLVAGKIIADKGFANFYPTYFDNDNKIIYISNKTSDYFSQSNIYSLDLNTNVETKLVDNVRSTLNFLPDKNIIIYSKLSDDNPNWYNVHDIFKYDLTNQKETRLTFDKRANQPNVSHNGNEIVFLFERDGTTNLGAVDIEGKNFRQITFFQNGEQVYNPKYSPDDSYIIFGYSNKSSRDIARVDVDGNNFQILLSTEDDERNPIFLDKDNLIISSNKTGIFNLYLYNINDKSYKQLTNVIGGAFMSDVNDKGDIVYAGYTSTGYKIFSIDKSDQEKMIPGNDYVWSNNPPLNINKPNGDIGKFDLNALKNFDDTQTPSYVKENYGGAFSKLSFFPYIRYDNYTTSNTFLQKLKPGIIVSSNDMLNRYSLFAGGSINTVGERDLFLNFNYRNKLPGLYQLGIKPELTLELYNVTRKSNLNVFFGADTVGNTVNYDFIVPTDVTYNLFEVDISAKQNIISRFQSLEFRFIWSRYSATLSSFLLPNNALYPTTNDTYFIGRNLQLTYSYNSIQPSVNSDINPIGLEYELKYSYEFNKFNPDGKYIVEGGILQPAFDNFNFSKFEFNSKLHMPLSEDQTLTFKARGATILGPTQPDFFDSYVGGLLGMRSYPFYAISGNEMAWINVTYRLPLLTNIDSRWNQLYFDKIFVSLFADIGNAWDSGFPSIKDFKKGAGAELRVMMNSFYIFPTALFVSAAYGFDKFTTTVRDQEITYGKEWWFYGGISFGFDF